MALTERQKIAHLLRRFGLGASKAELDALEPLGAERAFEAILNYEKTDEGFTVSPWEFCFEPDNDQVYLDPFRTVAWWSARLMLTRRPLQEKMTLFWHDHFAISAAKIEFGPMMLEYTEALRANAIGNFSTLLQAVSRTPAMLRFLDADENIKGQPNENFAREVLELFTVGIGNYTEKDIREAARAFTGWGIRYLLFERGGERVQEVARESMLKGKPMTAFCESPSLFDDGPKTVLGQTKPFTGDQLLTMLASRPETAQHLATKLWEFFAYPKPEKAVVDRVAQAYSSSNGSIEATLRAIVQSPEFWSDKCIRAIVKSPADFTIPILRQFGLAGFVRAAYVKPKEVTTPAPKGMRDISGLLTTLMNKQGMLLLYPPNVGGWEWGQAWITSNNMLERIKTADILFGTYDGQQPLAAFLSAVIGAQKPKTSEDVVKVIVDIFDANVPAEKHAILVQALEKAGGISSLLAPATAAESYKAVCRLLFGMPEFQFC